MPDTTTPNFGFVQPEIGASRDTWGTKTNANWASLDQLLGFAMPIGAILDFGGPQAPPGWLICDGRLISRVTFAALFAVIGEYWGPGDGATTFALPPSPGRASVGPGQLTDDNGTALALNFGDVFGAISQPIAQANLPNLALISDQQGTHNHGGWTGPVPHTHTTDVQGAHNHNAWTDSQGDHNHAAYDNGHTHSYTETTLGSGAGFALASGYSVVTQSTYVGTGWSSPVIENAGAHGHNIGVDTQGNHAHTTTSVTIQPTITADGAHQHNFNLGGAGVLLAIMQPILCVTKIIYAGPQGGSRSLTVPTGRRLIQSPRRGMH